MKHTIHPQKTRHENAQGMVEFALVFPVVLLLIYGIMEFGRMIYIYSSVTTASREAARYGVAVGTVGGNPRYLDCAGILDAAERAAILVPMDNMTISYDHGPGTGIFASSCAAAITWAQTNTFELSDRININITANYEPLFPIGFAGFPISSRTSRSIMKGIEIEGTPIPPASSEPLVYITTDYQEGNESSGMVVTFRLTVPTAYPVTIPYYLGGTAIQGQDYTANNPAVIPAGAVSVTAIVVIDDSLYEYDETITVLLASDSDIYNANRGTPYTHQTTILNDELGNDDPMPSVQFTSTGQNVDEGANGSAWVQLSAVSGVNTQVFFNNGGTATDGLDYILNPYTSVIIPAGVQQRPINLINYADGLDEPNETVTLVLTSAANATLGDQTTHLFTLIDKNDPPFVKFDLASQQGPEGLTLSLKAQLSGPSTFPISVPFTTGGTATLNTDYTITPSPLAIAPGDLDATINIAILTDTETEFDETIIITMDDPTNAQKGTPNVHTITIKESNSPPVVQFEVESQSKGENEGTIPVRVSMDHAWAENVLVYFNLAPGSATQGSDFTVLTSSPLVIPAGSQYADINVNLINDTLDEDNDETVILSILDVSNGTMGNWTLHTLSILDNDSPPAVGFSLSTQSGGEGIGTMTADLVLSAPSSKVITVTLAADASSTASINSDYTFTPTQVRFEPGELHKIVLIDIVDDTNYDEGNETIVLKIISVTNATIGIFNPHTITIIDNDLVDCPSSKEFRVDATNGEIEWVIKKTNDSFLKLKGVSIDGDPNKKIFAIYFTGSTSMTVWSDAKGTKPPLTKTYTVPYPVVTFNGNYATITYQFETGIRETGWSVSISFDGCPTISAGN
jgi:hypothetical protein